MAETEEHLVKITPAVGQTLVWVLIQAIQIAAQNAPDMKGDEGINEIDSLSAAAAFLGESGLDVAGMDHLKQEVEDLAAVREEIVMAQATSTPQVP